MLDFFARFLASLLCSRSVVVDTAAKVCRMVKRLQQGPICALDLSAETDIHPDGVRRWLKVMEREGCVKLTGRGERKGRNGVAPFLWAWRE